MQIVDSWIRDMPQQFADKHNIEVLVRAFAKQLQEVEQVYQDLVNLTDIDTATGQNLDYVGTIIPLTRKEAYTILRKEKDTVITDDVYRQVLKYKMLNNTSECTYYDIAESIHMMWGAEDIRYIEDPNAPATIKIAVKDASLDGEDALYGRATAIKPAGVKMVYEHGYNGIIDERGIESFVLDEIEHHMMIDFLRHDKMLDGSKLLDGTNLLDGLSTIGIKAALATKGCFVKNTHAACCRILSFVFRMKNESVQKMSLINGSSVNFWKAGFLDGEEILDGSHLLNSKRGDAKLAMVTGMKTCGPKSSVGTVSITTYNADYRLLRGTKALDGAKMLNSIYRKEDVQ